MFLKNTITGSIGQFSNPQGEGWIALTESEILAYELQEAKTSKLSQCKSYLSSTDWYAIRKADNGTSIPTEIAENRELARTLQDDINACTTIEELNAININFI
jgi:hypothetical protein